MTRKIIKEPGEQEATVSTNVLSRRCVQCVEGERWGAEEMKTEGEKFHHMEWGVSGGLSWLFLCENSEQMCGLRIMVIKWLPLVKHWFVSWNTKWSEVSRLIFFNFIILQDGTDLVCFLLLWWTCWPKHLGEGRAYFTLQVTVCPTGLVLLSFSYSTELPT